MTDLQGRLDQLVDVVRRKIANAAEREQLDAERDGIEWELVNKDGLVPREAAQKIRERLMAEGFTEEQIRGLGVSEHSIKPVARLRRKP